MSRADGSVIIDTRLDTKGLSKGVGNLKSQFAGIGSVVGKLGGMIAAAFSVRAIVNFGKEAVKLGSDLQEVQNVVDVTFTTMNEQVNKFAKSAMQTAGLSETMAKRYTGTFGAMAKSFKFSEEDAYAMATSLTQLSGDVASFYNLTQDVAYTKLKSVFTGETETLKDLGVVMTQTALDDFALRQGLAKTTSQMSEQEKVALRYQFVMEQLSGASGDFVRTQDSWANQTRVLSLQFEQLKATIGQGLINVLTPVLKVINQMIERFQVLADKFLAFTNTVFGNAGGASASMKETADSAEILGDKVEEAGKKAKKYLAPFDEISKITSDGTVVSTGGSFLAGGEITTEIGGNVTDKISPLLDQIGEKIQNFLNPIRNMDFGPLLGSIGRLGESFKKLGEKISSGFAWAWENILVPLGEWAIEEVAPELVDTLAVAIDGLNEVAEPLGELLKTIWDKAEPLRDALKEAVNLSWDNLRTEIKLITERLSALADVMTALLNGDWDAAGRAFGRYLDSLKASFDNFVSWWEDMMSIPLFENLVDILIKGLEGIAYSGSGGSAFPTAFTPYATRPGQSAQIPALAKGAVIPPRAEFLAVLGDQSHGRNLEAPEGLIRDIIKDEISDVFGGMMAGFEAVVEEVRNLRSTVDSIEVGDTTIGQAANRFNRRMAITQGGA